MDNNQGLDFYGSGKIGGKASGLLENNLKSPLAGIYQTKMIPNNQPSDEIRFRKLIEANNRTMDFL